MSKKTKSRRVENPEIEFERVPQLTEESKMVSVERQEYRSGIILDSIEELEHAFRIYDGGCVESSKSTEDTLLENIKRDHGVLGVGVALMGIEMGGKGFIDKLVDHATDSLKKTGGFHKHFDYDALGTRFFKTSVGVDKVDGKYILELCAAYVGQEPEENLAKFIDKPRALLRADANAVMSIVDDWWFNINLEDAVRNVPFLKKRTSEADEWAAYFENPYNGWKSPKSSFKHNGNNFALVMGLNAHTLRPENRDIEEYYIANRGKNIVGAAWKIFEGNKQISPTPENPSVSFSVLLPSLDKYSRRLAVRAEDMKSVYVAIDYIA